MSLVLQCDSCSQVRDDCVSERTVLSAASNLRGFFLIASAHVIVNSERRRIDLCPTCFARFVALAAARDAERAGGADKK